MATTASDKDNLNKGDSIPHPHKEEGDDVGMNPDVNARSSSLAGAGDSPKPEIGPDVNVVPQTPPDKTASRSGTTGGLCEVCSQPSSLFCRNCCVAYYCCREHQKQAWKQHKARCHPVRRVQQENESDGRKELVTARDISQGEVFLKESPLLIFPHTSYCSNIVCMECCNPIYEEEDIIPCVECGWELCSEACQAQASGYHKEFECPLLKLWKGKDLGGVLEENKIEIDKYFAVGLVRALLLEDKNPEYWALIQKMDSFPGDAVKESGKHLKAFVALVYKDCHLTEQAITHVVGVLKANSIDISDHYTLLSGPARKNASLLFPLASNTGPNCTPNARFSIEGRDTGNFKLMMTATIPISRRSPVSVAFEPGVTCTFIRRSLKRRTFFRQCLCERCKDPTELGTFVSGIKCQTCPDSYCVQTNPVQDGCPWICTNCDGHLHHREVLGIIEEISELLHKGARTEPSMESVLYILKTVSKLRSSLLHPNHFLLLNAEIDVCKRLLILASDNDLGGKEDMMIDLSKHILSVADVLAPGHSRLRGQLLYCLQFASVGNLLRENGISARRRRKVKEGVARQRKKRLEECREYQRQVIKIFEKEPEDSEEQVMMYTMKARMDVIAG